APSAYNPINNPKRATEGQWRILDRMVDTGAITPAQRDAARAETLHYRQPSEVAVHAEYVDETARQLVFSQYGEDAYARGLDVYLTIKSEDQKVAYQALRRGILNYERRQVYRGPEGYVDLPADPEALDARVADALQDHPDNDELKAAVVLEASPKKVVAMLQDGDEITVTGEGLKPATSGLVAKGNPKTQIRAGAVIRVVQNPKEDWSITQQPEVEGAFVAIDPQSGAVRALVGGFDYSKSKFNHVTQAWRQPGSSFKPFIYSAALEKCFTPATVINDAPLFFDAGATGSQPWEPKNYDGRFEGPMSMRRGLEKSKNMVSIRILQAIGPTYAQQWAKRFGFEADKNPAYLPMALGTASVTPLQMATAYSVFANGGYRVNPVLISKITDAKGRVLNQWGAPAPTEASRAIPARNAFVMDSLLQTVASRGTAAGAQRALGRPDIYGKTGTTNDSIDTWFVGFQPTVVGIVWIGYDSPRSLGDRETGGGLALPIWVDYMKVALKGVPVETYEPPDGVVKVNDEWYYDEYAHGSGIGSVGMQDPLPGAATEAASGPHSPNDDERKSILDLFRR
ncbi:MAG: penicillin-binding transpeptidase domain-containing protein, partial [Burkholderiaceae bacterium]